MNVLICNFATCLTNGQAKHLALYSGRFEDVDTVFIYDNTNTCIDTQIAKVTKNRTKVLNALDTQINYDYVVYAYHPGQSLPQMKGRYATIRFQVRRE